MSNTKVKVYFCGNWGKSSQQLLQLYKRQTPDNNGIWNNIQGTNNTKEADFFLVQDATTETIPDLSKVIFFGREPKHYRYFQWNKDCYAKFHHEDGNAWPPAIWWVDLSFKQLELLNYNKSKLFSVVDSGKSIINGHRKRLQFIEYVNNNYNIDVFGKINGKILPDFDKKAALLDYSYHLSIENGQTDYYFSEKFIDSILCLAKPFYYGARMAHELFPSESFIPIDIHDFAHFDNIIENISDVSIDSLIEARNLILYKYNIWPTLELAIYNRKIL